MPVACSCAPFYRPQWCEVAVARVPLWLYCVEIRILHLRYTTPAALNAWHVYYVMYTHPWCCLGVDDDAIVTFVDTSPLDPPHINS